VAAFLQRMGRSGRREDTSPNCTFLTVTEEGLLRAAAILDLHARGFVESVRIPSRAAHLLAHQIMALAIQLEGVPVADWWAWISAAAPFRGLSDTDRGELVAHMLEADILHESGGRLALGARGEKLYGWRNFSELYAVFSTPQSLTVLFGAQAIGTIDVNFAQEEKLETLSFILGAKAWRATAIDFKEGVVRVEPAADANLARWQGRPELLGPDLCRAIRRVLLADEPPPSWSRRAREKMAEIRTEYALSPDDSIELARDDHGYRLWTFAGGRANNLLGRVLETKLGERVVFHNLYIGFRDDAAKSEVAIRQAIDDLRRENRPDHADAVRLAETRARGRLSKLQTCLPARLEAEYLAEKLTDQDEARRLVHEQVRE
jgi:ATP-dependent Lhr-like helicase